MDPHELGTARQTRHSFSRALVRHASQEGWKISKRVWEIDDKGRGHAIIRVELGGHIVELVVFSQVIDEEMRTDRVIAQDWDVTSALVDGEVSPERLEILRNHVTKQEDGRADDMTLIWARANRSQRFFNYVADRLASGHQPEPDAVSDAAYILRSTAFYGNGKWGFAILRELDQVIRLGSRTEPKCWQLGYSGSFRLTLQITVQGAETKMPCRWPESGEGIWGLETQLAWVWSLTLFATLRCWMLGYRFANCRLPTRYPKTGAPSLLSGPGSAPYWREPNCISHKKSLSPLILTHLGQCSQTS